MKKANIVVVGGLGVVGGAVANYFKRFGHNVTLVDKRPGVGVMDLGEALDREQYVFVCVPTPMSEDGSVDTSIVENISKEIGRISARRCFAPKVIFKSTVTPGTTERMFTIMRMFNPRTKVAFNPEFLRQKHALDDMLNPSRIVVGSDDFEFAKEIMGLYNNTMVPKFIFNNFEGAELVKYYANAYYAARISFFNQMKEFADFHGQNHDFLVETIVADKSVGEHGSNPTGQPYDGACLPKDVSAIIQHGKSIGINTKLLKSVKRVNDILINRGKFCSLDRWTCG